MSTIIDMDLECDSMTDAAAAASPPPKLTTIDQLQKIMLPPHPAELSISRRRDWLNLFSRYLPETNGRLLESQLTKMHKYLPDAVTSGFDEFLENVKRYRRVPVTTKASADTGAGAADDEGTFTGPNTYGTRIMALLNDSTSLPDMSNFTISSSAAAVAAAAASINNNNESGSDNDNAYFEPPSSSSSEKKKGKKAVKQIVPLENKAIMDMDDVAAASSSSSSRVSGSKRRRANILSENVKLVPSRWNVGTVMNMGGRRLLGSIQAYIRRALEIRQIKSKLELKVARKEIQDDALLFVLLRKMIVYAPFNPAYDNNGAFALVMAQMANAASFTRKDNAASTTMCVACFENTPFRTGSDKDIRSGTSQMCSFSINSYIVPPKNASASKTKYFTACREHATLIEQWRDLFLFNNLAPFFEQLNAQMVTNTIKSISTAMKNVELRSLSWEMPVLLQPLPHVLLEMSDAGALCELIADVSWWSALKPSAPSSGQRPQTTEAVSSSMEVEPAPAPKAITLPAKRTAAVAAAPVVVEAEVESEPEFEPEPEPEPAPVPVPAPVVVSAKLARFAYAGKGKQEVPEEAPVPVAPAPAPATKFADDDFDSLFL